MQKEFIAKSKNGFEVYVDKGKSHAILHLKDTPKLLDLVKEIIEKSKLNAEVGKYIQVEKDMGRVVGTSDRVEIEKGDEIVYAKRPRREVYAKFVKSKPQQLSRFVTVGLKRDSDESFELITCYIGTSAPFFPTDKFETPESKPFWKKHALVWGTQEITSGTETTECPW